MNEVLFELLKAVIIVSIIVGMKYIIPWIKENTNLAKNQILMDIVTAAVQYAEQTITGNGSGAQKKAVVTEFLKGQLIAKNISISDEQLNALIESAVYAMNASKK
mgnify:CR=1 FL=1